MPEVKIDQHGMPEGWPLQEDWEVSPVQVKQMLDDVANDVTLLDCRLPKEHAIAKLDDAVLIPMQELADRVDELDDYLDRKLVVFCHAGARSLKVTQFLRERGFENVWSMAGGIDLWSLTVDHAVPRY